ncbi:reverse transcriptase domain-containing protein [Tanacetum coccineum]
MMPQNCSIRARENSAQPHVVLINDDLLTEILIRLPIQCIHLFTTVSKQWLRILTSPVFILNRSKIHNLDPPAGLFVNHRRSLIECDFVSLDSKLKSRKYAMDNSFTLGSIEEADNVKILQSCNEIGNWSQCRDHLIYYNFAHYASAIYWNDAFHWLETENRQLTLYKLNIEHHDDPIIKTIEITYGLHQGRNFLQSFGGSDDPMLVLIDIPGMLHLEGRLFESYRCLLLVCRDNIGSREFTIYEMMKGYFVWTVQDLVNTDEFMTPLLERWSIRSTV